MTTDRNFQVNLGGIIKLLSDHLYSGPEVFLRELLQNSVDAITGRKHLDPDHEGHIRIEVMGTGLKATIMFEDNGTGLTEEEVHQFLATIGESSKAADLNRDDFIGQFGIGLLSGFLVSSELTVVSQSIRPDSKPVEWTGREDGTYGVRTLDSSIDPGTRVFLRPKSGREEFFDADRVEQLLRHFGHHLPHKVELVANEVPREINETPPWRERFVSAREQREVNLTYGQSVFDIDFMDAIPLKSSAGQVAGVAYVLPFAANTSARQMHRVYLKDMLLSETVDGLLPSWAFFIRCVVNADCLQPNAARESFHENTPLHRPRAELGQCLKDYLVSLAEFDRDRLDRIIQLHYMPIKALALEDDDFFRLFIDWLPFETTTGSMTLKEYFSTQSRLRFVRTVDEFRQITNVAFAQNICLFNAGYAYDAELLSKVGHEFTNRTVEQIDVDELAQDFQALSLDESEQAHALVHLADIVLQQYKCRAEIRRFEPVELPTLYTASQSATFTRSLEQTQEDTDEMWGGILDSVAASAGTGQYAQLVFNFRNTLIQRLLKIHDRELLSRLIELLYLQALLLGHYPLSTAERKLMEHGLLGLIEHCLGESK